MKKLSHRNWNQWKDIEVSFLKDNYNKLSYQEIANKLNRNYDSISRKAFKLHLDSRAMWTEKENEILSQYPYNPKIWELFPNRTRTAITMQARKLGYVRQCGNYGINFRFFENWSPEVAYVIGFFMADGCVEPKLNRISIELSMKDYDHLLNIKNLMGSENPICIKKTRYSCGLYIHNRKMVNDIMKMGVIPNKTTRCRLPIIEDKYFYDFLRGYIDGDGSIYYNGNTKVLSILGNYKYINDIKNEIYSKFNLSSIILEHNKKMNTKKCYRIKYSGKKIDNMLKEIYYDNCFSLTRKMALARGVIPGKINPAQISQVNSLSIEEPESKTDENQINLQRLNAGLLKVKDDGIVHNSLSYTDLYNGKK